MGWEYCALCVFSHVDLGIEIIHFTPEGIQTETIAKKKKAGILRGGGFTNEEWGRVLGSTVARLGAEGWEPAEGLATTLKKTLYGLAAPTGHFFAVFKRPMKEPLASPNNCQSSHPPGEERRS